MSPLSVAVREDSCRMNGRDMLPFQGSSETVCSVGQASPWWYWSSMDLDGFCACHKHIQVALDFFLFSTSPYSLISAWTCVVSCHVWHHLYHVWWCHLWFQWLLHSCLWSDPSSSGSKAKSPSVCIESCQKRWFIAKNYAIVRWRSIHLGEICTTSYFMGHFCLC